MEERSLDALVFAPHPDDAELGMGGTIVKMIEAGKRVGVIDLTRGERGTKGNAAIRVKEADHASRILGLHYRGNLDLGDGNIMDHEENRLVVVEAIRRFRPAYVFICPEFDPHPDHKGAAFLVKAAFFLARLPKVQTHSPAHSPKRCLHYFVHSMRKVTFCVDITRQLSTKKEAMKAYRSQFVDAELPEDYYYIGTSDYLNQVEAYNRTLGAAIGTSFAEGFYSEFPLSLSLPTILE